jgi:hypothetical protein
MMLAARGSWSRGEAVLGSAAEEERATVCGVQGGDW